MVVLAIYSKIHESMSSPWIKCFSAVIKNCWLTDLLNLMQITVTYQFIDAQTNQTYIYPYMFTCKTHACIKSANVTSTVFKTLLYLGACLALNQKTMHCESEEVTVI